MSRVLPLVIVLAASSASWSGRAHADEPRRVRRPESATTEGIADAGLERMLAALAQEDKQARVTATKTIESLGQDAVPAIAKKLGELRKASSPGVTATIKAAAESRDNGTGLDLGDALVAMESGAAAYPTTVTTAVLLKALAHIGTTPAVRQLIKVSVDHGGAFRAEIARHVKALGDKAVPALIETRKEPSSELRHWAYSQLEAMGKRAAGDAVQTKDNQVLADVLRAFANVHDMDALPVLLSFVNSDRLQVRTASREALGQFGQDAIWKLREAYSNVTGKAAPEGWQAPQVAKELFAAYDYLRLQEVYGVLDEGLARAKEGKLEEATLAFDKVLARQPMIERRGEMIAAYVAYAKTLEEMDPPRSLALLRKAARLWPESPRANQIAAEIAYLEGKELLARGIADVEPFQRALTLDPGHEKARAELSRREMRVEERQQRVHAIAAAGVVVVVALAGMLLFGGRRRPRRAANA